MNLSGEGRSSYAHDKVKKRMLEWEKASYEREKAWEETATARQERRPRDDPDIRYRKYLYISSSALLICTIVRNKKNREEHALARLDHAQRDHRVVRQEYGDKLRTIARNRIPEVYVFS